MPEQAPTDTDIDNARITMRVLLQEGISPFDAIKHIRTRYGLSIVQAKEAWVQAAGIAPDLQGYQQQLADNLNAEIDRLDPDADRDP